jgi:galactose mutarotase-like enzyme
VAPDRKPTVSARTVDGLVHVTLSNGIITATFLPEIGGKIISLVRKASGHEFLLPPQPPFAGYRRAAYGEKFGAHDAHGFDECVPTVAPCRYADRNFDIELPDHGELWSASWSWNHGSTTLTLSANGAVLPYRVTKQITLENDELGIHYQIRNLSSRPFKYLWSAHPLLAVEPGSRILLPPAVDSVLIESSRGARLGTPAQRIAWPGKDLDTLIGPSGTAEKLFVTNMPLGWCALYKPDADETIVFRFDLARVPYLGIWICQGGWPETGGHFTTALEPSSGYPDSLAEAIERSTCPELAAHAVSRWELRIRLHAGLPSIPHT